MPSSSHLAYASVKTRPPLGRGDDEEEWHRPPSPFLVISYVSVLTISLALASLVLDYLLTCLGEHPSAVDPCAIAEN
jgi:hypothetical protein